MSRAVRPFLVDKRTSLEKSPFPLFIEILPVVTPYPLHGHNFSEITIVLDGQAEHQVDETRARAGVGDVYLLTGDKRHCFSRVDGLTVINVQFMDELMGAARAELRREPGFRAFFELEPKVRRPRGVASHLTLLPADLQYVAAICQEMERETRERRAGFVFLSRVIFVHLCGFLGRCYARQTNTKSQSLSRIGQALNHIEQRYYTKITIPGLAALAHMSESAFLRNFKEAMRRSPVDYLIRHRIEKACERLAGTEQPVTDIALEVGFNSVEYFSRKFREIMRSSPREYRRSSRAAGGEPSASAG